MDKLVTIVLLQILLLVQTLSAHYPVPKSHVNRDWDAVAQQELEDALKVQLNTNVAKNVVFFLGDGLGFTTVFAARVYTGQQKGMSGEEYEFEFEKLNHVAISKTYNVDYQVPDSAATATAFLSGVKAKMGTLGLNQNVDRKNCSNQANNKVTSIMDWSMDEGKSVGIVTPTRVTHATPSAMYAHSAERNWESDTDFKDPENQPKANTRYNDPYKCKDIALQLIEDNPNINVILGGGREKFLPRTAVDPEYSNVTGIRNDSRNLIEEWKLKKSSSNLKHDFVWNKSQFDAVDPENTDYLLGLFEPSHMQFEIDRDTNAEPSLAEMTKKAIQILQKNNKGFFLLVEGGRIDHAHHEGTARKALHDTMAMDEAVKVVRQMTSSDDTLVVVTADHSHSFVTGGYPSRGNNILGFVDLVEINQPPLDKVPYTTLSYGNGRGAPLSGGRANLTGVDTTNKEYLHPATVPTEDETHGGEDVPIYAEGPMAHLFHGVHEQNYIAHVMAYASCVGKNIGHCTHKASSGQNLKAYSLIVYAIVIFLLKRFSLC